MSLPLFLFLPLYHLQVQGSQVQLDPHLHPPFSEPAFISDPSKYPFSGATPTIVVSVLLSPKSGYILHLQPPHPLPHLQAEPHPQFPPQQDIFPITEVTEFLYSEEVAL
eukprot:TRINITY_DN5005_c0_g2_i1.p1 TRINITY_DN5005_c0_g2~~TRINITY_DN5005_c0_g2_i1.p1  ORF type:complete len:109 (+),score=12.26 TRINITY_DN5005_c0_g2_i1:253-579(+)